MQFIVLMRVSALVFVKPGTHMGGNKTYILIFSWHQENFFIEKLNQRIIMQRSTFAWTGQLTDDTLGGLCKHHHSGKRNSHGKSRELKSVRPHKHSVMTYIKKYFQRQTERQKMFSLMPNKNSEIYDVKIYCYVMLWLLSNLVPRFSPDQSFLTILSLYSKRLNGTDFSHCLSGVSWSFFSKECWRWTEKFL